jgi:hypothetical protein
MIKTDHVYRPPPADSVHETCLLEIMDKMTLEHKGQYILGDFNIDLQSSKSKSTTFSKIVLFTLGLGLKQLVTASTRTEARYVDGFNITSTTPVLRRVHAKTKITIDQSLCCQYGNRMAIHPDKTKVMLVGTRKKLATISEALNISICGTTLSQSSSGKRLGIHMDCVF